MHLEVLTLPHNYWGFFLSKVGEAYEWRRVGKSEFSSDMVFDLGQLTGFPFALFCSLVGEIILPLPLRHGCRI